MQRSLAAQLDYPKIIEIIAAHAQTSVGRTLLGSAELLPELAVARFEARMTAEMQRLIGEDGRLSMAGLDQALELLQPGSPQPTEAHELLDLLTLARRVVAVRRQLLAAPQELEQLQAAAVQLPDMASLVEFAATRLGRDGQVPDSASPRLARLRERTVRLRQQVLIEIDGIRRSNPEVVSDAPPTLRRDRYCLPVRASARGQMSGLLLDSSGSGATVFLEPYAVVELNNDLADASAQAEEELRRILAEVASAFAAARDQLLEAVAVLARLDASQAKALFGLAVEGRVVEPGHGDDLILIEARHPLIDERLHGLRAELFGGEERRDPSRRAVPLSLRLPPGVRTLVISGPNAGGKTVVLKTIGALILMAYQGIPLPVDEGTAIPCFDHLWCHIGDEQNVAADLSTFSAAMAATAELMVSSGARSLVLYDELGTGTDPLEGAALGCALLEELTRRSSLTVAATHLAAIAMTASAAPGMDNGAMEYDEERGAPTYFLRLGRPGRSRGLEIARAMGVGEIVLARARELLGGQHLELERWLRRLEQVEAELRSERNEVEREKHRIGREQGALEQERARLLDEREAMTRALIDERDRLRRRAASQLDEALLRLDQATRDREALGRRQRQRLREQALRLAPQGEAQAAQDPEELSPGMRVKVITLGGEGELQELRGSRALVELGDKRLWVERTELARAPGGAPKGRPPRVKVDTSEAPPFELKLIGMDREAAREELERFLDRALAAGRFSVRVVHGHGTGALRAMVAEVCRSHPAVRGFKHPPQHLGGSGVTEAMLDGDGCG